MIRSHHRRHLPAVPHRRSAMMLVWLLALLTAPTIVAADATYSPTAWPMFRGTATGSGRSAVVLQRPLLEHWQRRFEGGSFTATPVIAADRIYLGDLTGHFMALSLQTGETIWQIDVTDAGFPSAAAVSTDPEVPLVVVGDDLGTIHGFATDTGALQWSVETGGEISGGPTILVDQDPPVVLVGSQDAKLLCLRLADGAIVWSHEITDQIRCSPTIGQSPTGPRVFLAGCDGRLHIIDVTTGAAVAEVAIGGPTGTTPAVAGSRVFFGTEGGQFFAIDFVAGTIAWQQQAAAGGSAYRSSAAVADDLVVVGSRGRCIEAFATADGSRRWRQPVQGRVDASPVIIGTNDEAGDGIMPAVVVADGAGSITLLRLTDGSPIWEFDAGGQFAGSPAVVTDHLLLANEDGTLWCFRTAAPLPATPSVDGTP